MTTREEIQQRDPRSPAIRVPVDLWLAINQRRRPGDTMADVIARLLDHEPDKPADAV